MAWRGRKAPTQFVFRLDFHIWRILAELGYLKKTHILMYARFFKYPSSTNLHSNLKVQLARKVRHRDFAKWKTLARFFARIFCLIEASKRVREGAYASMWPNEQAKTTKSKRKSRRKKGGRSSAGRAPALHAGGQEFDPPRLHQSIVFTNWFQKECPN